MKTLLILATVQLFLTVQLFSQDYTGLPNDGYGQIRISSEQILDDTLTIHLYENNVAITDVYMVVDSSWTVSDSLYIYATNGVTKTLLYAGRISEMTGLQHLISADALITDKRYIQLVCPATGAVSGVIRLYVQWKNLQ